MPKARSARRPWKSLLVVAPLALASTALLAAVAADELEGKWRVVSSEHGGRPDGGDATQHVLVLKAGAFTVEREGQAFIRGKYTVDATKKPVEIDMKVEEHQSNADEVGKTAHGIIERNGDDLKWCTARPGDGARPTDFKTAEGSENMLVVFKREK